MILFLLYEVEVKLETDDSRYTLVSTTSKVNIKISKDVFDECKELNYERGKNWKIYWDPPVTDRDAIMWGYDDLDEFCESVI